MEGDTLRTIAEYCKLSSNIFRDICEDSRWLIDTLNKLGGDVSDGLNAPQVSEEFSILFGEILDLHEAYSDHFIKFCQLREKIYQCCKDVDDTLPLRDFVHEMPIFRWDEMPLVLVDTLQEEDDEQDVI